MKQVPEQLRDNQQFKQYYELWRQNQGSIVFVPMAEMLREQGCLDEARFVCEQGLKQNPESISGRLILASVYSSLGQMQQADAMAQEVLERMPEHPEAQRYLISKNVAEPGEVKSQLSENDPWENVTMVQILVGQGEYDAAAKIIRALLRKSPDNQQLRQRLHEIEDELSGEEKTVV